MYTQIDEKGFIAGTNVDSSRTDEVLSVNQTIVNANVRRSLPLTNQQLWVMAQTITEKHKKATEVDLTKVDWNMLQGEWFDWLEECLFGNNA